MHVQPRCACHLGKCLTCMPSRQVSHIRSCTDCAKFHDSSAGHEECPGCKGATPSVSHTSDNDVSHQNSGEIVSKGAEITSNENQVQTAVGNTCRL
eukprot:1529656-Amphidinium_carterae.1